MVSRPFFIVSAFSTPRSLEDIILVALVRGIPQRFQSRTNHLESIPCYSQLRRFDCYHLSMKKNQSFIHMRAEKYHLMQSNYVFSHVPLVTIWTRHYSKMTIFYDQRFPAFCLLASWKRDKPQIFQMLCILTFSFNIWKSILFQWCFVHGTLPKDAHNTFPWPSVT